MRDYEDLIGKTFGCITVIEILPRRRRGSGHLVPAEALVKCSACGKTKTARCYDIVGGSVKSCGCLKGNKTGKNKAAYKQTMRCYRCPSPEPNCTFSTVLRVCCWECPKRETCGAVCDNRPEKCGAKKFLANEETRDFLTQKKEMDI